MEGRDIYRDIAERTEGDVYIGVVGPVRTGKSTFIKRFMDLLVLPRLESENEKRRVTDELPQSGAGRTIMTTQPRFVPNEAAELTLDSVAKVRVRLVDCVGYMVEGALGFSEDQAPRMVRTPWSDEDMEFSRAAEMGTHKVITEHSTIGVVMTTDGTITDLPRPAYEQAESRVVSELKKTQKPFVMVLNSKRPKSDEAGALAQRLTEKYDVPVLPLDVLNMTVADLMELLETVLFEFPLKLVHFQLPGWMQALPRDHWLSCEVTDAIKARLGSFAKVRDYDALLDAFDDCEHISGVQVESMELGSGILKYSLTPVEGLFYSILGEQSGCTIESDYQLMSMLTELVKAKREYERVADAMERVRATGYAIIPPELAELTLDEPELLQKGNQYGVRLRAAGPSLHMIRAEVDCEVSPIVGTQEQGAEMVRNMLDSFEADPKKIWNTELFGKPLHDLVAQGVNTKLDNLSDDAKEKLQDAMTKLLNETSGMICIVV